MNIIRLSWSSYQTEENLLEEGRRLRSLGHSYLRPRPTGPRPGKLTTYDAIVINSQFTVDASFLSQWDREGLILTASSGYDHIDLEACRDYGVTVGRTPESRAENVADYVRGALHMIKRDFLSTGHPNRSEFWNRPAAYDAIEAFDDKILGIVGFGVIGARLPEYLSDFDFERILACDPLETNRISGTESVEEATLNAVLSQSDYLTLHADLNPTTRDLIDASALDTLGSDSVLINAARGAMVELETLLGALDGGEIGGAILDVLPEEPPDDPEKLRRENLIVTPHSAGFGPGLTETLTDEIVDNIEAYDESGEPLHPVTPRSEAELDSLRAGRDAPS